MLLCLWACPGAASAETFQDILGPSLTRPIAEGLARSVGRALPVISASAGFVYRLDPEGFGALERETSVLGQLFLERAEPIGRRRLNLSLSYQWVRIDQFEGEDLGELRDTRFPIEDPDTGDAVVFPLFGVKLESHQLTASATYGVTDDLDLNLTVPVLWSDFQLRIRQRSDGVERSDSENASAAGVGDVFLRGKYRFLERARVQSAIGLVLRLPAGNEENFQGTGEVELAPKLYASGRPIAVGWGMNLRPHVNAGVNFDVADVGNSEVGYGLGLDLGITDRLTAAAAVLGRHALRRIAPAGFFSLERTDGQERPLFGIDGKRPDMYDVSVGGRVSVWRDTVILFANALVALNDEGVRADVIPTVGVEAAF
jgi:hypothetical protein